MAPGICVQLPARDVSCLYRGRHSRSLQASAPCMPSPRGAPLAASSGRCRSSRHCCAAQTDTGGFIGLDYVPPQDRIEKLRVEVLGELEDVTLGVRSAFLQRPLYFPELLPIVATSENLDSVRPESSLQLAARAAPSSMPRLYSSATCAAAPPGSAFHAAAACGCSWWERATWAASPEPTGAARRYQLCGGSSRALTSSR